MDIKKLFFFGANLLNFCKHPSFLQISSVGARWADIFFLVFITLLLLFGRWKSIIFPYSLNADEAQAAANALRIRDYGFNWDLLDGTTVGPLNSLILAWPQIFGLDVTFSTTRMCTYLLLVCICFLVYCSIKIVSKRLIALLFSVPLVVFYSFTKSTEFLHYSSETLPLCMLVIANYINIDLSFNNRKLEILKFIVVGALVGAVPFAKIQATPVALVIGLYALFLAVYSIDKARFRNIVSLGVGGLLPSVVILIPLYMSGQFSDFWQSYIVWAGLYIKEMISIRVILEMIYSEDSIKYFFYFQFFVGMFSLLYANFLISSNALNIHLVVRTVIYLAIILGASLFAIARPGNPYVHYLTLLPPFILIFFGCASFIISQKNVHLVALLACYLLILLIGFKLLIPKSNFETFKKYSNQYDRILERSFIEDSPNLLSWMPIKLTTSLVWGYAPQWYLWTNTSPATRESHTYAQMSQTKLSGYFRSRFIKDLSDSKPEMIIDAANKNGFPGLDLSHFSPDIFPEFSKILSNDYFYLNPLQGSNDCPKIFIKNRFKKIITDSFITPKMVSATDSYGGVDSFFKVSNLFDESFIEDICVDYWLLPNNTLGEIKINLSSSENISKLMILNTQNSRSMDRSTKKIQLKFIDGDQIALQREITLRPYPNWTEISFESAIKSNQIDVSILSFTGFGAGLNEIKIFRAH